MKGETASCLSNESLALLQLKQSLSLEWQGWQWWPSLSTWKNESNCCKWEGITCDHTTGFVIRLDISELGVQVSDPNSSLFQLSHLQSLDLSRNLVTGLNLSRLSELTDLAEIRLSLCKLIGPIPESFKQLSKLTYLDLHGNELSGEIPPSIVNHPNLQTLYLADNKLNGSLPDSGNDFSLLVDVNLSSNMLDGEISPSILKKLPYLETLNISGNRFTGTVDFSLFLNMRNLSFLDLSWNNLTVEFPKTVYVNNQATIFPHLTQLLLKSCNIKGNMPTWVRRIPKLNYLDLSHNKLDGFEEPININGSRNLGFSFLYSLYMSNNNIKGAILSTFFCNMFMLDSLDLSENKLTGTIPDCLANLTVHHFNLSHNHLSGSIPEKLMRNAYFGLDLSYNNLQGRIPYGKQFDATSFDGNPELCGPPLSISCPSDPQDSINHVKEIAQDPHWEYLAVGIGYTVGFLTTILPILFIQKVGTWFCVHVDRAFETCINIPTLSSIFSRA